MPNLVKDPSPPRRADQPVEPNLWRHPGSSNYYVKKYVAALGKERVVCLETTDRDRAIALKRQVLAQWEGAKLEKSGAVIFDSVAFELLGYMESKAEKTFLDYESHLRLHLLPFFTGRTLEEIPRLWPRYRAEQRRLNPKRKLRHDRKHLRRIYSHAEELGLITAIPRFRLDRKDETVARQKEFTDDEYWALLAKAKPKLRLKIQTYMKTGMRANEVRLLKYQYINWKTGAVTLPPEVTKMTEERVVVFDRELLAEYRRLFERAQPTYVFPHRDDPSMPASATDKDWQKLKKLVGITKKRHWFRGSAAKRAIRAGAPESNVRSSLGMSQPVFARVYHEANEDDRRKVSEAIADSVRQKPGSSGPNPEEGEP